MIFLVVKPVTNKKKFGGPSRLIVYGWVLSFEIFYVKHYFFLFPLDLYNCEITKCAYAVDVLDSNVINKAELHIDNTARNLDYR